jgi:yecA family protein
MTGSSLDFETIQQALERLQAMTDASEAHGTLCGLLLGQQDFSRWLEFTLHRQPDPQDLVQREQLQVLNGLYEQTRSDLNAEDMDLQLVLPDESDAFSTQLLALGNWCRGFLYGLGVNGESLLQGLSDQGRECMDDLLQISQLSHDEEQNEESEIMLAEIVEHVRLSVIYLNEEINPVLPAPQMQ